MTVQPRQDAFRLDNFLHQQERKDLLRFIACGSVDHGKSTLLGRLLYEARFLFDDQVDALKAESRKYGTQGKELDFSLLLDGLAAEREQKITIDVAYRFFTTDKRKFIVADAPGHEQYTRNMATGASTADVAVILVDAASGLTRQTRRHSLIVATLGVRHFAIAVNKMDLVGWSETEFRKIEAEFRAFAESLDVSEIVCIPLCARGGDNIVNRPTNMDWYRGPTLLNYLEQVEVTSDPHLRPFRLPIQLVNRPSSEFRGYSGLITGGDVYSGMAVRVLPSGETSYVDRIVVSNGDGERASAGQSVTITLVDEIDASRGDIITAIARPPMVTERLKARVVWMGKEPLAAGRGYLIKLGTCSAKAVVEPSLRTLDLETRLAVPADRLGINDIGHCTLKLDRPVAVDRYADSRETGSFILIDPDSYDTVGMGLVETADVEPARQNALRGGVARILCTGIARRLLGRASDSHLRSIAKAVSWRATGSLDTFFVTLIVTGNTRFAGAVALTEIMTKVVFYYLHERVWSLIPWGQARLGR